MMRVSLGFRRRRRHTKRRTNPTFAGVLIFIYLIEYFFSLSVLDFANSLGNRRFERAKHLVFQVFVFLSMKYVSIVPVTYPEIHA
jgi:hypothetical protein